MMCEQCTTKDLAALLAGLGLLFRGWYMYGPNVTTDPTICVLVSNLPLRDYSVNLCGETRISRLVLTGYHYSTSQGLLMTWRQRLTSGLGRMESRTQPTPSI